MTGLNERFDFLAPVPSLAELGHVHLMGIGGIGMSSVARLLHQQGSEVSGCDQRATELTVALERSGIPVQVGHAAEHCDVVDTLVVTSAVRPDHPELREAQDRGIRVLHRAQALASLLDHRRVIAVAGANGKSTTSAMAFAALTAAGAGPSAALGAEVVGGSNAALGTGDVFVVEADESDASFLVYRPSVAVVTNIRPDHLDFYGDIDSLHASYRRFAGTVRAGGLLIVGVDDPGATELGRWAQEQGIRVLGYGANAAPAGLQSVRIEAVEVDGMTQVARLAGVPGVGDVALSVPMPGLHNLSNATAAFLASVASEGAEAASALLDGLRTFAGTHRRFETRGVAQGITVVDDYAHNADKVAAVVSAARSVATGRLVVVFQPHLYSRTRDSAAGLAEGLRGADYVVLAPIYPAREEPISGVTSQLVADHLMDHPAVVVVTSLEDSVRAVLDVVRPGDLVLTVGAGDVTQVAGQLVSALEEV